MAKSAILAVKIIGDSSSASKSMDSVSKAAAGFAAKMGAISGIVQSGISKAFNSISSSVGAAVSRVDTMANFPKIMQNLGYSSQDATASIQKMSDKLMGLPTSLDEMAGMTQKLAPLTGGLGKATDLSLALNNALLAGGKGTAVASNAMEQYSQMLANGKPDLQSWKSMTNAMPGQMNQLAIAILGAGHNSMDLYESMKDGTVSFGRFNDAVLQLNDQGINGFASFSKQAKDATNGIATSVQNMKTALVRGLANTIGKISPFITDMMGKATQGINKVSNMASDGLGKIVNYVQTSNLGSTIQSAIDGAKSIVEPALEYLKTNVHNAFDAISQSVGPMLSGVKTAFQALKDVAQPFVDALFDAGSKLGAMQLDTSMWALARDAISGVGHALETVGRFVSKHKDVFQTLAVEIGVVGGVFLAGKVAIAAWNGVLGIWNGITKTATAVQGAFNLVMEANPIMLVVTALAALIAGLVYFFTQTQTGQQMWSTFTGFLGATIHSIQVWFGSAGDWIMAKWQSVQGFFSGIPGAIAGFFSSIGTRISQPFKDAGNWARGAWDSTVSFFSGIPGAIAGFFSGLGDKLLSPFKWAVEQIKSLWNSTIGGFGFNLPDWIPGVGGKSFKIPMLAQGGILRSAGTVLVGEAGPELLSLPMGAQVTPLSPGWSSTRSTAPINVVINIDVDGVALDGYETGKRIARALKNYTGAKV